MDLGPRTDERAALEALIEAAAPGPVPADHALALLRRLEETDPATLGRLAYHALTGVDPGEGDPEPPSVVAPGFPPFAAEVLMRAISGPDHRRPTAQALLIVLDTVPLASWPAPRQPEVVPEVPAAPPVVEPMPDAESVVESVPDAQPVVEPVPDAEPVTDLAAAADAEPEAAAADSPPATAFRTELHEEFRSLLNPSRPVPRFDPLKDPLSDPLDDPLPVPWEPDASVATEPEPKTDAGAMALAPADETVSEQAAPEGSAESAEESSEEQPEASTEKPLEKFDEEPAGPTPGAGRASGDSDDSDDSGMHDEFRAFVSPSFAVPLFEPLEGELPVGSERVRRRRRGGRPSRRDRRRRAEKTHEPTVGQEPLIEEDPVDELEIEEPEVEEPEVEEPEVEKPDETDDASSDEHASDGSEPESEPQSEPQSEPASDPVPEASEKRRGRLGRKGRQPHERHTVAHNASDGDRLQTLILVAVILVLIALGIVYAASQGAESTDDPATPQGASRSMSHPAPAAE